MLIHEVLRVSVCNNLEDENYQPIQIKQSMIECFLDYFDYYIETCEQKLHLDGLHIFVNI